MAKHKRDVRRPGRSKSPPPITSNVFDALPVTEDDHTAMNSYLMERFGCGNAAGQQEESITHYSATVSIPTEAHAVDAEGLDLGRRLMETAGKALAR